MLKRIASLSFLGLVGGLVSLVACTGGVSLGKSPSANTAGDPVGDGSTATGPYGITCTGYWRANGDSELVEQKFTVRSDATGAQTLRWDGSKTTGPSTLAFNYAPASDSSDEANLVVTSAEVEASQTFRLSKTRRPVGQFIGDHGFTGLLYIGPRVQYICAADGAAAPPREANVVPLNAVCQVELRSGPGGAVERRETYALTTPTRSQFDTQTFTQDDVTVSFSVSDSLEDARAINVRASKGADADGRTIGQLFQLDRNAQLYNQLAGTTFSGRIALGTSGKEVSYACSSKVAGSGGNTCPAVADSCAAGCVPIYGSRYDSARNCRAANTSVVSCGQGLVGGTTDAPCLVRSDGVIVFGSGSLTSTGAFTRCDDALNQRANEATTCTAAPLGATCSNGTNSCDMTPCATDEVCFTQVSCGPAAPDGGGGGGCTLGDATPADNTCHKSCNDSATCPSGQECVKKVYFGCSDYNGPAEGRGICMAK